MNVSALASMPRVVGVTDYSEGQTKRMRVEFANGYTASIIQGPYSYGGEQGLYEIAVLHGDELIYDTPITDNVLGRLHSEEVPEICMAIAALPDRT